MKKMKCIGLAFCLVFLLAGCSAQKNSLEKLKDLDFTVVDETDIPAEMADKIAAEKEEPLKLTYADKGVLYICEGYGRQETSGYSIEVTDCYETKNAIYIHTNLLGPTKDEKIKHTPTYPYIVIKMEYNEKNVVFD